MHMIEWVKVAALACKAAQEIIGAAERRNRPAPPDAATSPAGSKSRLRAILLAITVSGVTGAVKLCGSAYYLIILAEHLR